VRSSLQQILIELCGNAERAAFWAAFSSVAVSVIPLIFAIQAHPDAGSQAPAMFELADELKWGGTGPDLDGNGLGDRPIHRADLNGQLK